MINHTYRILLNLGWLVFSARNKRPLIKGASWKCKSVQFQPTQKVLKSTHRLKKQLAIPIPKGIAVIDIDSESGLKSLQESSGIKDLTSVTLTARSGRGFHLYFIDPSSKKLPMTTLKGIIESFEEIDIKKEGGYMICPCSWHSKKNVYYEFIGKYSEPMPLPKKLKKYLKQCYKIKRKYTDKKSSSIGPNHPHGIKFISSKNIRIILNLLPVEQFQNYEDFFQLLASVHHASGGCAKSMTIFLNWSRNDNAYNDRASYFTNRSMWLSCSKNDRGDIYTYRTLLFILKNHENISDAFCKSLIRPSAISKEKEANSKFALNLFKSALTK